MTDSPSLQIAGTTIEQGMRVRVEVPVGRRFTGNQVVLPVEVVRGRHPGPCLFVCAAIHGDEINGVEIIRRVLQYGGLRKLRGTLLAVPVVNVFGFVGLSRYLPDRRDLNRSFPGSRRGSLASRLAHTFLTEIVANATHGIDLHTAAVHRSNLPQVRAGFDDPETTRLARAFGAPVIVHANVRDGSLRGAVVERGIPMLVYEAGEALRFDETAIRGGVRGVLAVMRALEMLPAMSRRTVSPPQPVMARSTAWVRAPEAGILRTRIQLGRSVELGAVLGTIADPLGTREVDVVATQSGVVIGRSEIPLVNEGDALFHVATFDRPESVAESVAQYTEQVSEPFD